VNTTLLFFLFLVPLSGFIAWAGDKIGHRIGKRRHTVLGLRPRHTATLITVLSGVGIAGASFAMMFLSSASFREVVARGNVLRWENTSLQQDNLRLSSAIQTAGTRVRALQKDAEAAEAARNEALKRRTEAEKKYDAAEALLKDAKASLVAEKQHLDRTESSLRAAQAKVAEATRAVQEARARRRQAEQAVQRVEARLTLARSEARAAQAQVDKATNEFNLVVQEQKRRLDLQRKELERLNGQVGQQTTLLSTLQTQYDGQTLMVERQRGDLSRLGEEVASLERRRTELERRREEAQGALDDVVKTTTALRNGRITYRVGEEVTRMSLPTGGGEWKNHNALEGLLTLASRQAQQRGARTAADGIRAVWIPTQRVQDDEGRELTITEFAALHEAAKNITKEKEEVVVVVTALGNAVVGEPVPVNIRTWRNPMILRAGASLGELTLDGTRSGSEIADVLYTFLRGTVRQKLLDSGTIPVGDSVEASVGETSVETLLKALDAVRATKAKARVTVRVARDLRAADPVALAFDVRPVDGGAIGTR